MAKKKQTQQPKSPKMVEKQVPHQNTENTPATNNDEKLSNLKCLNAMLVNETAKKRQEISALLEDKKSLEAELTRSNLVADSLRSELTRVSEDKDGLMREKDDLESKKCESDLEIEGLKKLVDYLKVVIEKGKDDLSVVLRKNEGLEKEAKVKNEEMIEVKANERSVMETVTKALRESEEKVEGMRVQCEGLRNEVKGLRKANLEQEGQISHLAKEVCGLKNENEGLRKVDLEKEGQISNLGNEICGLSRENEELRLVNLEKEGQISNLAKEVCGLKKDVEGLSRENGGLRKVNLEQGGQISNLGEEVCGLKLEVEGLSGENEGLKKVNLELDEQISDLGKEVCGLNAVVLSLRGDVEMWRVKFFELEKSNCGVVEELEELKREFGVLVEEKKMREEEIGGLIDEKSMNLEMLGELEKEIECMKRVSEELEKEIECMKRVSEDVVDEKNMLEVVKSRQEGKIRELQREVDEIRGNLLSIQESNKDQLENNKKLLSEITDHKSVLDRFVKERDAVKRALEEEKMNGVKLKGKVSEISMKMEETAKVIEELRGTSATLVADKKVLENNYTKMAEEKGLIEKNFVKAKETIAELEGSLKAKSDMLESALVMLRNTAMQLSVETKDAVNEGITVNDRRVDGGIKPYMTELGSIRAVFKGREEKVREMEKEMEKLKLSVLDGKRKKSFWTLVSSATIFAAVVSFAYAKGFL